MSQSKNEKQQSKLRQYLNEAHATELALVRGAAERRSR